MDTPIGHDRLSEERAFIQRYTDSIAHRPVNYGKDFVAPSEKRQRKVGLVEIPLAEPPSSEQAVAGPSSDKLELTIKSLKPAFTIPVTASSTDSVLDLKQIIERESSTTANPITVDTQRLLIKGKALLDSKLLKEYSLTTGSTVHLVLKPTSVPLPPAPVVGTTGNNMSAAPSAVPPTAIPNPSGTIPRPSSAGMGHHRVPSLTITTDDPSPSGGSSPGKEVPLTLTDAPPLGPQAQISSAAFHQTISDPAFWQKIHALCVSEFENESDADQAWEGFLVAMKARLSAGEAAKIRDVVGVRGMGGA